MARFTRAALLGFGFIAQFVAISAEAIGQPEVPSAPPAATAPSGNEAENHHQEGLRTYKEGDYETAARAFQRAIDIWRVLHPDGHASLANSIESLGATFETLSRLKEAEDTYREALAMRDMLADAPSIDVARGLQRLGTLLANTKRPGEGEPLLQRSIELCRQINTLESDGIVLDAAFDLASIARNRQDWTAAATLAEESIDALLRARPQERSPNVASRLALAGVYAAQAGRPADAEPLLWVAADIYRELDTDPSTGYRATCINFLAQRAQIRAPAESIPFWDEAIELQRRVTNGIDDASTATLLRSAAIARQEAGKFDEALPILEEALAMRQRLYPDQDHEAVAQSLNNLGVGLQNLGRLDEAASYMERSLDMYQRLGGGADWRVPLNLCNLVRIRFNQHRLEDAETLYQRATNATERFIDGKETGEVVNALVQLSSIETLLGRKNKAAQTYERALGVQRALLKGADHQSIVDGYKQLAALQQERGKLNEAAEATAQADAIAERLRRHVRTAAATSSLAALPGKAEPDDPATSSNAADNDPVQDRVARLEAEAEALGKQGRWRDVRAITIQILDLQRSQHDGDHASVAQAMILLGTCEFLAAGRPAEGDQLIVDGIAMHRRVAAGDNEAIANSLHSLANTRWPFGRAADALPPAQESLEMRRRIHGGDQHESVSESLTTIGNIQYMLGDDLAALDSHQRALSIRRQILAADDPLIASSLKKTALTLDRLARWEEAMEARREADQILASRLDRDTASLTTLTSPIELAELADRLEAAGKRDLAERALTRAWRLSLSDGVESPYATMLGSLLTNQRQQLGMRTAATLVERVNILTASSDPLPLFVAAAQAVGDLDNLFKTGRWDEANHKFIGLRDAYDKAQLRDSRLDWIFEIAEGAFVLLRDGNLAIASERFEEGRSKLHHWVFTCLPSLTGDDRQLCIRMARDVGLQQVAYVFATRADPTNTNRGSMANAVLGLMSSCGLIREAAYAERTTLLARRDAGDTEIGRLLDDLCAARDRYAVLSQRVGELAASGRATPSAASALEELPKAKSRVEELDGQLKRMSPEYASAARLREFSLADCWQALREDQAVVEFGSFEFLVESAPGADHPQKPRFATSGRHYAAAIVTRRPSVPLEQSIALVDLGPVSEVDALIDGVRTRLDVTRGGGVNLRFDPTNANRADVALEALHHAVWAKLTPHLSDVQRVYVAPDGRLAEVPFNALVTSRDVAGGARYLIEDVELVQINGARELARLWKTASRKSPDRPDRGIAVLLGDPDFDATQDDLAAARQRLVSERWPQADGHVAARDASPATSAQSAATVRLGSLRAPTMGDVGRDWQRLQSTATMTRSVASMLREAGVRVAPVLERDMAQTWAVQQMGRPRILQFATHGFFIQAEAGADVEESLLKSGLVLAGANRRSSEAMALARGEDTGLLTASQVMGLDLRGTELVGLTACHTGQGDTPSGEGALGLAAAFSIAGARSTLVTLWEVPEVTTLDVTHRFYQNWLSKGLNRASALRLAQLELLEASRKGVLEYAVGQGADTQVVRATRHPWWWAAMVLSGDPGDLPEYKPAQEVEEQR